MTVATKSQGKVLRVDMESDLVMLGIRGFRYMRQYYSVKTNDSGSYPCLYSPNALNNVQNTTPTARPGTTVHYRVPV